MRARQAAQGCDILAEIEWRAEVSAQKPSGGNELGMRPLRTTGGEGAGGRGGRGSWR